MVGSAECDVRVAWRGLRALCFALLVGQGSVFGGETQPYPETPGLETSDAYQVFANAKSLWTEKLVSRLDLETLPEWFDEPYVTEPQEVHVAQFSGEGEQSIRIELEGPAREVVIRPLSRGIRPEVDGKTIRFTMSAPDYLVVEADGLAPLFLFADPKELSALSPDDPNVRRFGPGEHRVGYLELRDNETLYLAPGAIVYGGIRAKDVSNVRITGRGILDGDFKHNRMVLFERCENVLVEGITIRNGDGWTNSVLECRDVEYRNVKVISFGPAGDGINPLGTQNMKISQCFLRCTDDCVAIKSPEPHHIVRDVVVEDSTMIGFAYSDGVTIGFETNGESISDVVVRNCDILMARGGSRVEGHSGFSIICDGPADIHNILYEEIRVEQAEEKLFELHVTDGSKYGAEPPGQIRDVRLRNVSWSHEGPIVLQGLDASHSVRNVVFENCRVAGRLLSSHDDPALRIGNHVEDIQFE